MSKIDRRAFCKVYSRVAAKYPNRSFKNNVNMTRWILTHRTSKGEQHDT